MPDTGPTGTHIRGDWRRIARALIASVATGTAIYLLVMRAALPAFAQRLTAAQIGWLREAFMQHPGIVLATIALIAAVLASPVLVAFRLVYGPFKPR